MQSGRERQGYPVLMYMLRLERTGSKSEQETDGLKSNNDLFREGGVRVPGSEETIQGPGEEEGGSVSGCVVRGERVSCPGDSVQGS